MRFPLDTLHNPIVVSVDPDAKYSPSHENTAVAIGPEWSIRVFIRSPLDTLHNPIVPSQDPDIRYSPFLENATLDALSICPVMVFRSWISLISSKYNLSIESKKVSYLLSLSQFSLSPPSIESSPFLTIILSIY